MDAAKIDSCSSDDPHPVLSSFSSSRGCHDGVDWRAQGNPEAVALLEELERAFLLADESGNGALNLAELTHVFRHQYR